MQYTLVPNYVKMLGKNRMSFASQTFSHCCLTNSSYYTCTKSSHGRKQTTNRFDVFCDMTAGLVFEISKRFLIVRTYQVIADFSRFCCCCCFCLFLPGTLLWGVYSKKKKHSSITIFPHSFVHFS